MSQGQRVTAEIQRIRAALAEKGDRIRKLPRQAVWIVHHHSGQSYRLTFQSTPLSAWSLHPQDQNASELLGVIERVLNGDALPAEASTYQQQLHPWCVMQLLPDLQRREVARFRRRNDADAHTRVLRQQAPENQYIIVFDPVLDPPVLTRQFSA